MPANLDRAWQHLMSACTRMAQISARTLSMLLAALDRYRDLARVEEIMQRAYLVAALS